MQKNPEFTQMLSELSEGNKERLNQLTPIIIDELHKLASQYMSHENSGHTLQSTALVNEAYIKLVTMDVSWNDRLHFFAIAAKQMRHILVDHARAKLAQKRGGKMQKISFDDVAVYVQGNETELIVLDELMKKLEVFDERATRIFELRIFSGLSNNEIAEVENLSLATVEREIRAVKAWFKVTLDE
ncbi:MAG: RNA polymerase subunit sigma-24 [Gammaproteobacteria bacterium]|nr:MAG: RNA polymerase subunit sigma-24 [Gammaproteobacteria bacterium]PCJ50158.1 MAG: RNA polymerase subunit sigma-24 [Gammaproteobacteria bacterium]